MTGVLVHIGRDVRQAVRMMARAPVLAAVVVVSLGVGIGVNTVVFAWIQARLFHPLPGVRGSAGIQLIEPRSETGAYSGSSWLDYRDLEPRLTSFSDVIAFRMAPIYVGDAGRVERVFGQLVSGNYFSALGVQPVLGRFPDAHASRQSDSIAVISYGTWQTRYGGAMDVVGRTIRVNARELTIIGVTPREFQGTVLGLNFDVWIPAPVAPVIFGGSRELDERGVRGYALMGRLAPGASREQAQAELDAAMRELAAAYPKTHAGFTGDVLPFSQSPRGPQRLFITALVVLQGMMLLLLLAVCGNTANLMLARASARQREVGVRLALGAGPWRIASLLLTESVVLAVLGAMLGAGIAILGTDALVTLPLSGLPVRFQTSVDAASLAFAIGLGVLSGMVVGAVPAVHLARIDPLVAIRSGLKTAGRSGLRHGLMGAQVALALVVLIVAGLFVQSVVDTRDEYPGFRREGVMLGAYDLAGRNAGPAFTRAFPIRVLEGLRAVPAVESAAIASAVPLDIHGLSSRAFTLEGRARTDGTLDSALTNTVTPGYFGVMEIPLRTGRDFADLSDEAAPPQVIVNAAFVRQYLEGVEPLGRRLQARGRTYTIAGVAADSLSNAFGEPPTPVIYFSYRDNPTSFGEIHVRARGGSEQALTADVRRVVHEIDPELPVFNTRTLTDHVETNLVFRRVPARLFSVLGPMLLGLAAIGIYAVVAYTVSLRTTEIGVRLALGATRQRLIAQFVGESLSVIALGSLVGWAVALVVAMAAVGDAAIEPLVFIGVPAVLLLVAALASWIPARRAAHTSPMAALRDS
jgi:predicted permease